MSDLSESLLPIHEKLWQNFRVMLSNNCLSQSILLVAARHQEITRLVDRLTQAILCTNNAVKPCSYCSSCRLWHEGTHPDMQCIHADSQEKAIKIDQIRALQLSVYQAPQCSAHRVVVINPADKMNSFAINALLKILEEPPSHTYFLLITEQLSTIPSTILSRCQRYVLPSTALDSYLQLGEYYALSTTRGQLLHQKDNILDGLHQLCLGQVTPCLLAAEWTSYVFDDVLWFLYLICAEMIHYQLIQSKTAFYSGLEAIEKIAKLCTPVNLFAQLDEINGLLKKINHTININQTLALENLLLGFLRVSHDHSIPEH
ncbi:MAG: DNA polymerase III subunit delta' C-terminal domain-containing protein [Legionella sp.]